MMSGSVFDRIQQRVNGNQHGGRYITKATKGCFLWLLCLECTQYFLKQSINICNMFANGSSICFDG